MKKQKIIIYIGLVLLIAFNFYLYRNEFKVASDPNDNVFHYGLIDESNAVWKNVFSGKTSIFSIFESWNERWGEGFPLSLYYSHLPQALISLISSFFNISSFRLFVVLRTLFLI